MYQTGYTSGCERCSNLGIPQGGRGVLCAEWCLFSHGCSTTMRRVVPVLPYPFHCWATLLASSPYPFHCWATLLPPVVNSRFTVGCEKERSLCSSAFCSGIMSLLHPFPVSLLGIFITLFPFHCWAMLRTALTVDVHLLPYTGAGLTTGNIPDSWNVRRVSGRLFPFLKNLRLCPGINHLRNKPSPQ